MIWVIAIIILIIAIEGASRLLYSQNMDVVEIVNKIFNRSRGGDIRTLTLRYAEHPFLGYSLNPEFVNSLGEKVHNKYGFRNKDHFSDMKDKTVIYCAGDSSTYCNFIEKNENTWPYILQQKLQEEFDRKDIEVINGGCGAWTSYQSLVRFSAWVDVLKPNFVIVYSGKTDFIPFMSGDLNESEIFPDYSNVMHSLRLDFLARALSALGRYSYTGKVLYARHMNSKYLDISMHVYNLKKSRLHKQIKKGLERISSREWDFIFSRYRSFASLCKDRNIPILFVTQQQESKLYKPYMDELTRRIKSLKCHDDMCFVYDFAEDVKGVAGLISDSVHFTELGARVCAERICAYIVSKTHLFKKVPVVTSLKVEG